jgi:hypothetical protein
MTRNLKVLGMMHKGKAFKAGPCVVTIGGFPVDAIAVFAGSEKFVTTFDGCIQWLIKRGLPGAKATKLVTDAEAGRAQETQGQGQGCVG